MKISTGYLTGNLDGDGEPLGDGSYPSDHHEAYGQTLLEALQERFPAAEISVDHQHASGSLPFPLQTHVEADLPSIEDDVKDEVFEIANQAYGNWIQTL